MPRYEMRSRRLVGGMAKGNYKSDSTARQAAVRNLQKRARDANDEIHVYRDDNPHRDPTLIGYAAFNQMGRKVIWCPVQLENE